MSRYHSYLNSAKGILAQYTGEEPFSSFLKKYFSANKKFGSKDRKQVSNLCYCFFRMGKAVMNISLEEKILTALFLCSDKSNEILEALKPEWNYKVELPATEKLVIINYSLLIQEVFPWKEELSIEVDFEKFRHSFLVQPDLFIRLRPGSKKNVKEKLQKAAIQFEIISDSCLSIPNSSKIDQVIELDKEAVIQDFNSQQVGEFFKSEIASLKSDISLWDCCAGSGGKSIMAYDLNPAIEITVSDMRESILANLKKRFEKAGIKKYKSFVIDLTRSKSEIENLKSQIIIADVPCTGSGTWSRTPEQLYFFNENPSAGRAGKIEKYASVQKQIIGNVIPHLKPGGFFLYITCSVFKKENEDQVEFIKSNFNLELIKMELFPGYDMKADTMFAALFKKQL